MARPKEKISTTKTKTLLDRCEHEKENLKKSVIKKLQDDIGSMLDDNTHSDLTIQAGGIDIQVHKIILKARSPAIYNRFVDLSTGNSPNILVMPWWVSYDTARFIIKRLYFVESDPLDETVDKQDEVLMDYLKSLLFQREKSNIDSKDGSIKDENGCENCDVPKNDTELQTHETSNGFKTSAGDEAIVNDLDPENALNLNSQGENPKSCDNTIEINQNSSKSDLNSQEDVTNPKESQIYADSVNGFDILDQNDDSKHTGSTSINKGETTDNPDESESSVSNLIKLSYDLTLPYEGCNRVGDDLLRVYLQEVDTDCQIAVSGDHFKAHKCILAARSSYFSAMLGGAWRETDTDINLEGVTPSVVEQLLLYLYGGVVDIMDSCSIEEYVMAADMYGLEGVKAVAHSYLKREYCHMFHKICPVCEELLPEALTLTAAFHMDSLKEKCIEWINRNMIKMWRTKFLAKQPQEMLDLCYNKAVEDLNRETAIETLLTCQNLHHNIPRLRWSEPLLCLITKLNDSTIEFISCQFISVLQSAAFRKLDKGLGYKISLLEETFEAVIKSLPINKACEVYKSLLLKQIQAKEYLEQDLLSVDYCDFIDFLFRKCEDFLKLHVHQVINTPGWELLSKDTQSKLLEGGSFVILRDKIPDPKMAAKARTEMRRNYVPTSTLRKGNKTNTKKVKSAKKSEQVSESTEELAFSEQSGASGTEQRDSDGTTREKTLNSDERHLEDGAVGGMAEEDVETYRSLEDVIFDVEYVEAVDFTAELIPILNVTFETSDLD